MPILRSRDRARSGSRVAAANAHPAASPPLAPAAWSAPSAREIGRLAKLFRPLAWYTHPLLLGVEHVPTSGPALLVGNHTILGVYDLPLLFLGLWESRRILPRSLGHHAHFRIPVWRDFLSRFGAVEGTRENCARLFDAGELVLVFPGGGREVAKRRGERYQLLWKNRLGFARMAIRHRVPIIPFAAVGAEDAWDIVADANLVLRSPLGKLLARTRLPIDEMLFPLVRGIGPTPIPRPERLYFQFQRPIATTRYRGAWQDDDACSALRDRVRASVERGIRDLRRRQASDPERWRFPGPWSARAAKAR